MTPWQFFRYSSWCRLSPRNRYLGFREDWHDGPIWSFGFWRFHVYSLGFDHKKFRR